MASNPLSSCRQALDSKGLWPKSALARFTTYLVAVTALFRVIVSVAGRDSVAGKALSGWMTILTFIAAVLLAILAFRWTKNQLLWRLRNRLIVTYMFIGVIPVVLILLIGFIAGYLFAGQFATFIATEAINEEVQALQHANTDIAIDLANQLNLGAPFSAAELKKVGGLKHLGGRFENADLIASNGKKTIVLHSSSPSEAEQLPIPRWLTGDFSGLVEDQGKLFLRSATKVPVGSDIITVLASAQMEGSLIGEIASSAGEIRLIPLQWNSDENDGEASKRPGGELGKESALNVQARTRQNAARSIRAGAVPPSQGWWDKEIQYFVPVPSIVWSIGPERSRQELVTAATGIVSTRVSALYTRLFSSFGQSANLVIIALVSITIVFGVIELFALMIGIGLTRTMTQSVANLYEATQHVNLGDLKYRIQVKSRDQLAALQQSFNSMSASIEKLLVEQKEKERMQSELEIAQEVQAQLFPRITHSMYTVEVHGICKPARTVSGDYYDFLSVGEEKLGIAVGDISGKGISAALLMATIHSAVRVYELGRMPEREELVAAGAAAMSASNRSYQNLAMTGVAAESPASVLSLLNRHLYHSTPAEKYATLFLGVYDGNSRSLTYANGGHLPPLLIAQDGAIRKLTVGGTVIGLFEDQRWEQQRVNMHPGELFVAFSDGITEPENEFGEFGEQRLIEIVREHRNMPLARISEVLIAAVQDWIGVQEQPDDVTLVLARAL
jgi:phosphoserine phosphatase RsbU/P